MQLDGPPQGRYIASPLGLIPKHDGGWRRIHDLSCPKGHSVNDFIPKEWGSLEYATFDEATEALLAQGQGAILVKKDLANAFRHIPIASSDLLLMGFFCDGFWWIDTFLPFGLRTAPFIFDLFAKGLHWILITVLHWHYVLHYLDDFLAILPPSADAVLYNTQFNDVCADLGFDVQSKKDITGTKAEFLGIQLDTTAMEARLPPEKLARMLRLIDETLATPTVTHHQLQSVVGLLSFGARVVIPGRAVLRRLFDALRLPIHSHRITTAMEADLRWWKSCLSGWNGVRLLRSTAARSSAHIWTDASGKFGLGGYLIPSPHSDPRPDFTSSRHVPTRVKRKRIQFKEMLAVKIALSLWLDSLRGTHVLLYCDNFPVCRGIEKSTIHGEAMAPLRHIALLQAKHDILITVTWIPTNLNMLADMLSRFQYYRISQLHPQLSSVRATKNISSETPPRTGTSKPLSVYRRRATSGGASPRRLAPPTPLRRGHTRSSVLSTGSAPTPSPSSPSGTGSGAWGSLGRPTRRLRHTSLDSAPPPSIEDGPPRSSSSPTRAYSA